MRRYLNRALLCGALFAATAPAALAGCSSGGSGPVTSSPTPSSSAAQTGGTPAPESPSQSGAVGVSPGGVTTAVDVPAESTEDEYAQACHAAKVWMDGQHADPKTLVEPYLKVLQTPSTPPGPATFNMTWSQLTPARQAAAIVAVQAGADAACG
jgi:hypothetical protein